MAKIMSHGPAGLGGGGNVGPVGDGAGHMGSLPLNIYLSIYQILTKSVVTKSVFNLSRMYSFQILF